MMLNEVATEVPSETSVKKSETRGLTLRESPCPWEYAHLIPRRDRKTATDVALFGRLLIVTSLNRIYVDILWPI